MGTTIYTDGDADLRAVDGRRIAVLGYGNQGRAQALNLRDSGAGGERGTVIVGNRDDDYLSRAHEDGFPTSSLREAAAVGDVVLLLIPDEVQPAVFAEQVAPGLRAGDTLVVASGYNVAFGLLEVPDGVDVVMVAPRMIGAAVRSRFVQGAGFPCFVSVERDATGAARRTALAIARGIGGTRAGAIASSAREEAALDLFSEQAIWPAILSVLRTSYEVLHKAGFSDEAVLYEMYLSGEPAEVFTHVARDGLLGQLPLHSQTSQYGQLRALCGLDASDLAARFTSILHEDILSGAFAREWSAADAGQRLAQLRQRADAHPLSAAEQAVLRNQTRNQTRP
ncbi:MAG: NAD(P)-binding domain-containing protein [Pseudonocardia sp.]|nr:NAD(P)-binding domain-containing protein [Pseudonocardia sp.]